MLLYFLEFDKENPKTWKDFNPNEKTAQQLYEKFGVDKNTQDFTGHAAALYRDDEWVFSVHST